jgi:hypothetical protein
MLKTQFRTIDRRTSEARAIAAVDDALGTLHRRAVQHMVERVVAYSPVDTGTYMDSHNVREGRTGGSANQSSHRKPRDQSYSQHAAEALDRMTGQVESLGDSRAAVVANDAVHARFVEYGTSKTFGYMVYSRAREDTKEFIRGMVAEMQL